ncbi:MAG: hypothetical protein BGO12_16395 [Verrucomicrobia bacterium 61-8]|nr:DUF1648 domain-containing protein [Verrucomicrobiota bacterium]OJV16135.1 MAG: hypothetical protein BGO12_16395 [Verrucomicrobia bacterium 61-8]
MRPLALLVAIACAIVFIAVSLHDYHQLPDRIASHFDITGTVNGWMGKTAFTSSMLAVGLGIPVLFIAAIYLMRFLPTQYLNLPGDSWRDPSHFRKACDYFLTITLWYAAAFLLWQTAFTHQIVAANLATPPRLDGQTAALLVVPIFILTLAWIIAFIVRFFRPAWGG